MSLLGNGCVCCQMGGDLALTIAALLGVERPGADGPLRRIVLETSGLSKPGPILRQVATLGLPLRVAVLATFDVTRGLAVAGFEEAAAQWAGAQALILTKGDAVTPERFATAGEEAASVNPLARIIATPDRAAALRDAFALREALGPAPALPDAALTDAAPSRHPRITAFTVRPKTPLGYDDLAEWLDNLAGRLGERLLRLKGLVRVAEASRPFLVESVGTLFARPRPFGSPDAVASALVVIVRDTGADEIEAVPGRVAFAVDRPRPVLGRAKAGRSRPAAVAV
jgi:G3E family GTPase